MQLVYFQQTCVLLMFTLFQMRDFFFPLSIEASSIWCRPCGLFVEFPG